MSLGPPGPPQDKSHEKHEVKSASTLRPSRWRKPRRTRPRQRCRWSSPPRSRRRSSPDRSRAKGCPRRRRCIGRRPAHHRSRRRRSRPRPRSRRHSGSTRCPCNACSWDPAWSLEVHGLLGLLHAQVLSANVGQDELALFSRNPSLAQVPPSFDFLRHVDVVRHPQLPLCSGKP